jgi:ABC-2 type transport system permease protein
LSGKRGEKMKIKRVYSVIKREFITRVMKKSFLIFTLLTPILLGALMVLPSLMWMVKSGKSQNIMVFDETNSIYDKLVLKSSEKEAKGDNPADATLVVQFLKPKGGLEIEGVVKEISNDKSELDGILEIKKDEKGEMTSTFYGKNISNIKLVATLERLINEINLENQLKKNNIPDDIAKELQKKIDIKAVKIEKGGKTKESSFLKEYIKTFIATLLLYFLIVGYGQTLMRGVMEEKSSRVVEILLSSLKPSELLLGKVVGIASVGLFEFLIWTLSGIILFLANPLNFTSSFNKSFIKPEEIVLFLIFFVLGFLFYASIFAAVGSVCSTDQEVQQVMIPIVIILIFPVLILGLILQNPNALWLIILSVIPIFSPTLMMTRLAIMSVPLWQTLLSIAFLIGGIIFVAWAGGKIFRTGILMTGKMPNIFEILKWIKE